MQKFDLKEKYDVQGEKFRGVIERYEQKAREAGTRLADLKAQQAAILREEFATGKDRKVDKTRTRADITEAERELAAAELERTKAYDFAREAGEVDRITPVQLVQEWNGPYRAQVRDKELKPITERMAAARETYLNAVLDFYELRRKYAPLYNDMRDKAGSMRGPDGWLTTHEVATLRDLPQITNDDLSCVHDRKSLPAGVKRTSN
ncbi:hypothetical protein ACFSR7_23625 [Cohnella sp. GCM10020058]|uniref:hypothetical protein n=1 Tax=Cohnella sp. GCM10020058 TaxID=3317330 RepID=UPI00363E1BEB